MEIKIVHEKGHFFDEKQKQVKQKIMENLMDGLFLNLHENQDLFKEEQAIIDLFCSIIVMFNREVIVHFLVNLGLTDKGSKIMRNLFDTIRKEVVENINLAKN